MEPRNRPAALWVPLVLVGSVLFWTVAMGLGGLSLSLLGDPAQSDSDLELAPESRASTSSLPTMRSADEAIPVHLESWSDAHAVAGASGSDDGTGSLPAIDE